MTREEAIKTIRLTCPKISDSECDFETAMRFLIPELAESEDERIRKWLIHEIEAIYVTDGIVKNENADKALAWLEKQKEQKEIPLMNGDADLYFDEWNQQNQNPTKRQCFEEGMRYAQKLQKEQKPVEPSGKLSRQDYLYQLLIDQLITYSDYEYLTGKKPVRVGRGG